MFSNGPVFTPLPRLIEMKKAHEKKTLIRANSEPNLHKNINKMPQETDREIF